MTRTELNPVILSPISLFKERRLSVTIAIESPKERATLSTIFICLKKTSVQAKPGRKNTSIIPKSALIMDKDPNKEKPNSKSSLIEDIQSMPYIPSQSTFSLEDI